MLRKKIKSDASPSIHPFEDPSSIGNVLLKLGRITPAQLREAVGQRAQFDELLLGGLLQKLGFIEDIDIADALRIQAEMRRGNPLAAELDILEHQMVESERGARELSFCIDSAKQHRRDRGEQSGFFLVPNMARARS